MVVFKHDHVIPLFVADSQPPQEEMIFIGTSNLVEWMPLPNINRAGAAERVGKHRRWDGTSGKSGEVVWLPGEQESNRHAISMKRRFVRQLRERERRALRVEKWTEWSAA